MTPDESPCVNQDDGVKAAMRAAYRSALSRGTCDYWQDVLDVVRPVDETTQGWIDLTDLYRVIVRARTGQRIYAR